jgi:carbamoyltransferase
MNVLGIYNPATNFNKKLKQGGACLISNNKIAVAISEERITRIKHDSGYINSLNYCLEYSRLNNDNIDLVVTSSCCDYTARIEEQLELCFKRIEVCDHHLSHAYSAYFCSKFDNAIIIILDGGGNTLNDDNLDWWRLPREQVSIFTGINGKIELLERLFNEPYETGFGEMFRYVTKYLGFGSSYNAGKVMALSSYINQEELDFKNLFLNDNEITSPFSNNPVNPIPTFQKYLESIGFKCSARSGNEAITFQHKYLAYLVQKSYQLSLKYLVTKYINKPKLIN